MTTFAAEPQFKVYLICSSVLTLQMLVLGGMTAARRAKVKGFVNPEDAKVAFDKEAKLNEGGEHPEVARILRAHRNLLESLPMFLALGLAAVLAGANPLGVQICCGIFTGARLLHSIVYLNAVQPWRTVTFAIGSFAMLGLMVMSLMAVFS
jgi:prostaglandin-E synthase 1